MYDVKDICKWFLAYNDYLETNERASKMSPLKLQKLLYYAQSSFLEIKNEPLFPNEIVAWTH